MGVKAVFLASEMLRSHWRLTQSLLARLLTDKLVPLCVTVMTVTGHDATRIVVKD